MRRSILTLVGATGLVALAGNLSAKPALGEVEYITEGLIAAGIAYEISEVCGDIDARLIRGLTFLNGLKSHARGLGYTDAEIDAFTDDKAEQDRLEGIARARLASMGAVVGQPETYCTVGSAEISRGSTIGSLLR